MLAATALRKGRANKPTILFPGRSGSLLYESVFLCNPMIRGFSDISPIGFAVKYSRNTTENHSLFWSNLSAWTIHNKIIPFPLRACGLENDSACTCTYNSTYWLDSSDNIDHHFFTSVCYRLFQFPVYRAAKRKVSHMRSVRQTKQVGWIKAIRDGETKAI